MLTMPSEHTALAPFDARALHRERSTIYALTSDLRISYVNSAWARFAKENGASWVTESWGVGERIMDAIPAPLQPFYQYLFDDALGKREIVEHEYECSSPTTLRRFRMRILPCESGGLLVVHSPLEERPHSESESPALESLFRNATGVIVQCSHCRRVQRADAPDTWAWVPTFVAQPLANTSHGLCSVCVAYYYGADVDE